MVGEGSRCLCDEWWGVGLFTSRPSPRGVEAAVEGRSFRKSYLLKHYFNSGMSVDLITVCSAVGALCLLKYVWVALHGVYARVLRPGKNIKRTYGDWAVVTGATDGIGKAMAFEFARKGCNVLLISRSADKLQDCQMELKAKYSSVEVTRAVYSFRHINNEPCTLISQVDVLAIDFKHFDAAARARVTAAIAEKSVGVLVCGPQARNKLCLNYFINSDVGQ